MVSVSLSFFTFPRRIKYVYFVWYCCVYRYLRRTTRVYIEHAYDIVDVGT